MGEPGMRSQNVLKNNYDLQKDDKFTKFEATGEKRGRK